LTGRYTIFNHDFNFGPQEFKAHPSDHTFATKVYKILGKLLASGKFKPNPVRKYAHGLAGIEKGFKDAEYGKVLRYKSRILIVDSS
jgi:hypothetical protein